MLTRTAAIGASIAVLIASLVFWQAGAWAQPRGGPVETVPKQGGEIRGRLVDKTGVAVSGEQVKLLECEQCTGGKFQVVETPQSRKTTAGKDGRFNFANVSAGEYALQGAFGPPMKRKDGTFVLIKVTPGRGVLDLGDIIFE